MTKEIGWSVRTGFFEPLRVHIVNEVTSRVSARELRVPCCQPADGEGWRGDGKREMDREAEGHGDRETERKRERRTSSEDAARLERLLRAHEQAVARQRTAPDALELVETFSPLLAELRKSEGRRARVVELSTRTLGLGDPGEDGPWGAVVLLPDDLRQIAGEVEDLKIESTRLEILPPWLSELTNLRNLEVCASFDEIYETNSALFEIPASIVRLSGLRTLRLQGLEQVSELPDLAALTGLESLSLERNGFFDVPACTWEIKGLKELKLDGFDMTGSLAEGSIGGLTSLTRLQLAGFGSLHALPSSMGQLTGLQSLSLDVLSQVRRCPEWLGNLTGLTCLTLKLYSIAAIPSTIGRLTRLEELEIASDALADFPRSMEALTALRNLSLHRSSPGGAAVKTLARLLPSFRLLKELYIDTGDDVDNILAIARSFKAWPPPCWSCLSDYQIRMAHCWQVLGLPPEAATWNDKIILAYFQLQQDKVLAFAGGTHRRLGAASAVSWLEANVVIMIMDGVLGTWSLLKQWRREDDERGKGEQASGMW